MAEAIGCAATSGAALGVEVLGSTLADGAAIVARLDVPGEGSTDLMR